MIHDALKYLRDSGIITVKAFNIIMSYVAVSVFTIYGYRAYEKIAVTVEKVAIIERRISDIEYHQRNYALSDYERDNAQNRYIIGLSTTMEFSTNSIIEIQKEIAKDYPNMALINYRQEQVIEEQKKNLPHHQIYKDSAVWVPKIGVRKLEKKQ